MQTELTLLGWTLVLALIQILLPAALRNRETGSAYNLSARDQDGPPLGTITARLQRAQRNLFETLPIFAIALLIAHVTERESVLTLYGAWIYLIARIIYVPLYAAGIALLRTLTWLVAMLGLALILYAVLH